MYADDTALYAMSSDIDELIDIMNKELVNVRDSLVRNKLSLNVSKTEFVLMGTRPRLAAVKDREVNVNINGAYEFPGGTQASMSPRRTE